MNNKNFCKILICLGLTLSWSGAIAQSDSSRSIPLGFEVGFGGQWNLKYGYGAYHLRYYSPRIILKRKIRIRSDVDGFRTFKLKSFESQSFPFSEYTTINVGADYLIPNLNKTKLKSYLLPHLGFSFIFDVSKIAKVPSKGIFIQPRLGADYYLRTGKWRFALKSSFTFFTDGLWFEVEPAVLFDIWSGISIGGRMNFVNSFTYNGNAGVGMFPGFRVVYQTSSRSEPKKKK